MIGNQHNRVAIIGGTRTPFVKAGTVFKNYTALDLAVHSVKGLLTKYQIDPLKIDELVYGTVIHNPKIANIARELVFASHLPSSLPAYSVSNNCITGTQAITNIYEAIYSGRIEIGLAGGTESMSNVPILFQYKMAKILQALATAKTFSEKLQQLIKIRPHHFKPDAPAVAEPSTGLSMGEHCEIMAKEWHASRAAQDEIAYKSHMNAFKATQDGRLKEEIYPLADIDHDLIIRADTSLEKLAKLPPVFDKSVTGTITAGNSSPLTDGASTVLLASEQRAKQEGWKPLAFIKAFEYAAIDPKQGLLMAPALAVPRVLQKAGLSLQEMGIVEMHEAFGAQIICNLLAWEKGWIEPAIGRVNPEILNPLGSSIAVGHPFAATGGRIVTTLANEMQRRQIKYGLISICAAGAEAVAMILELA